MRYAASGANLHAVLLLLLGCGGSGRRSEPAAQRRHRPAAQQVFRWKLITTWPKNLPALGMGPERLAEQSQSHEQRPTRHQGLWRW